MYLLWPVKDGSGIPEIAGKGPGHYTPKDDSPRKGKLGDRRFSDEKALISQGSPHRKVPRDHKV